MDLFGIRIGVDVSWFLILFLMIFLLSGSFRQALHSSDGVAYLTTVITVLLFFGSLIVHELGHALVARRQGIEVEADRAVPVRRADTDEPRRGVTRARSSRSPPPARCATFLFVLVCLAVDLAIVGPHRLVHAAELDGTVTITPVLLSLSWLLFWNVLLLLFNLVPAFPLDGGRIARADRVARHRRQAAGHAGRGEDRAGVRRDPRRARDLVDARRPQLRRAVAGRARVPARASRPAGRSMQTALTERIEGVRVADIMDRQPWRSRRRPPVGQALDEYFLRYGWSWFPVIDEAGRFVGIARQERLQAAVDGGEGWLTVGAGRRARGGQLAGRRGPPAHRGAVLGVARARSAR